MEKSSQKLERVKIPDREYKNWPDAIQLEKGIGVKNQKSKSRKSAEDSFWNPQTGGSGHPEEESQLIHGL